MLNSVFANKQKVKCWNHLGGLSFLLIASILLLISSQLMAQGNLLISPHRVVFEGSKRIMEINLANSGQDSAKYSISFLQYKMNEDGAFVEITAPEPGLNFSDKNVRIFPRIVTLGPKEAQVVKIQLTNVADLAPGEYRSHIYFRAIANQKALGEDDVKKDTASLSIKLVAVFGITVPVIIRVGESTTTLKLTDLKIEKDTDGTSKLMLTINRTGNMSAYGDIAVMYKAPNGTETKIGMVNGVAVYTPLLLRKMKIDLENKSNLDLSKGTIRAIFSSSDDTHPVNLAEAEFSL
jgi:hypothetical protein